MKVLFVEPGKVPRETEIEPGLDSLRVAVGGHIEAIYPFEDPVGILCNEEGKLERLPLNRALYDDEGDIYDILAGNFLIVGLGKEDFADLPDDLIAKYKERFLHPEEFAFTANGIRVIKLPDPETQGAATESTQQAPQRGKSI